MTARRTQSTWSTAPLATSWYSRASRRPPCRCPSSRCAARLMMRRCCRPSTSLSSVPTPQSPRSVRCRWLCRRSATGCWPQRPSTFDWSSATRRSSCGHATVSDWPLRSASNTGAAGFPGRRGCFRCYVVGVIIALAFVHPVCSTHTGTKKSTL